MSAQMPLTKMTPPRRAVPSSLHGLFVGRRTDLDPGLTVVEVVVAADLHRRSPIVGDEQAEADGGDDEQAGSRHSTPPGPRHQRRPAAALPPKRALLVEQPDEARKGGDGSRHDQGHHEPPERVPQPREHPGDRRQRQGGAGQPREDPPRTLGDDWAEVADVVAPKGAGGRGREEVELRFDGPKSSAPTAT